ncbi:MAG TPA: hypothetical protein DCZ61_05150, partial [Lachnospiraceae bacterium]|nr:hypothetical protein [Lachnospiraceae bacterium]
GREIGLYVYYEKGDKDGDPAHENTPEETLLHVTGMPSQDGDSQYFGCYIGVNLENLSNRDESGNLIIQNGKRCIIREGEVVSDLENTMVQEMFRAVMYDYNRAGMLGFADSNDYTADYKNLTPEQENKIKAIQYPAWFIEGAASMVRNTYQSKTDLFNSLLENRRMPSDEESAEYGYLAVLYLSELAARSDPETGSAMTVNEDGTMSFSSQKICSGLNSILERMHDGETLDEVIHSVAPKDKDGVTVYSGTDDFAKKFFCGSMMDNGSSETASSETDDGESLAFVTDFLSYMHDISEDTGRQSIANGSVLFDFEEDFETPLDRNKEETSDEYKIIESNTYVESTVPDSVALNTGGKSDWNGQTESAGPVEEAGDHSGAGTDPADAEIAAVEPEEVLSVTETLTLEPEAETVDVE